MVSLALIAEHIIKEQELVIGSLAWSEAEKVSGLKIDSNSHEIHFSVPDTKNVIDLLVAQYERLFGKASHEVCREAAAPFLAQFSIDEIPKSLR